MLAPEAPQAPPAVSQPQGQPHPFDVILQDPFPGNRMLAVKGGFAGGGNRVMHLGATNTHWVTTLPNGHAVAVAPAQAPAGKTSSLMIPAVGRGLRVLQMAKR